MEAHGGAIRVESEPGAGSKFIISLPRKRRPTARAGPGPGAEGALSFATRSGPRASAADESESGDVFAKSFLYARRAPQESKDERDGGAADKSGAETSSAPSRRSLSPVESVPSPLDDRPSVVRRAHPAAAAGLPAGPRSSPHGRRVLTFHASRDVKQAEAGAGEGASGASAQRLAAAEQEKDEAKKALEEAQRELSRLRAAAEERGQEEGRLRGEAEALRGQVAALAAAAADGRSLSAEVTAESARKVAGLVVGQLRHDLPEMFQAALAQAAGGAGEGGTLAVARSPPRHAAAPVGPPGSAGGGEAAAAPALAAARSAAAQHTAHLLRGGLRLETPPPQDAAGAAAHPGFGSPAAGGLASPCFLVAPGPSGATAYPVVIADQQGGCGPGVYFSQPQQ